MLVKMKLSLTVLDAKNAWLWIGQALKDTVKTMRLIYQKETEELE
jgi:hypothetical protein